MSSFDMLRRRVHITEGVAEVDGRLVWSTPIGAGANPKAVQTMLGHASAAMTLDTYADLFPDDLEAVADRVDRARAAAMKSAADELRSDTDSAVVE